MTENPSTGNPADPSGHPVAGEPKVGPVPAGYDVPDQPSAPGFGPPAYQQPVEQVPTAYPGQQQGWQQPQYQQPYAQQQYQQPYSQQQYQQPAYGQQYGGQKSKVAAGVLGILLGGLGIHNFYLGFTKKALIQLLVSVLSVGFLAWAMAIWGLIEGILILVGNEGFRTDARGVPLRD